MSMHPEFETGGFFADTAIATPKGARRISWLAPGDRVISRDRGTVTLRRVVRIGQAGQALVLPAGALGPWRPDLPLAVVPGQMVLLRDARIELLFGAREVLCPAEPWAHRVPRRPCDAYQLVFDRQEVVLANGLWCASGLPARQDMARRRLRLWEALLLTPQSKPKQRAA